MKTVTVLREQILGFILCPSSTLAANEIVFCNMESRKGKSGSTDSAVPRPALQLITLGSLLLSAFVDLEQGAFPWLPVEGPGQTSYI